MQLTITDSLSTYSFLIMQIKTKMQLIPNSVLGEDIKQDSFPKRPEAMFWGGDGGGEALDITNTILHLTTHFYDAIICCDEL